MSLQGASVPMSFHFEADPSCEKGQFECQQLKTPDGLTVKLSLPISPLDEDLASISVEQVAKEIMNASCEGELAVEKVVLDGLKFKQGGMQIIKDFLADNVGNVEHLALYRLSTLEISQEEVNGDAPQVVVAGPEALFQLTQVFEGTTLSSIDLSFNVIGASLWETVSKQKELESIILDEVHIDSASMQTLNVIAETKLYTGHISSLVLKNRALVPEESMQSLDNILFQCTELHTLKIGNLDYHQDSSFCHLPYHGIYHLSQKMVRLSTPNLRHLEVQGSSLKPQEYEYLCLALEYMPRLFHLRLSYLDISATSVSRLAGALTTGGTPLRILDLSHNVMGDTGMRVLSRFIRGKIESTLSRLRSLNVEHNSVTNTGAVELLMALSHSKVDEFDLRIAQGNEDVDLTKVALRIAVRSSSSPTDGVSTSLALPPPAADEDSDSDLESAGVDVEKLMATQAEMLKDIQTLQQQVQKVTQERDILIQSFSVLGASKAVEDRTSMMRRLSALESQMRDLSESNQVVYPTTGKPGRSHPSRDHSPPPFPKTKDTPIGPVVLPTVEPPTRDEGVSRPLKAVPPPPSSSKPIFANTLDDRSAREEVAALRPRQNGKSNRAQLQSIVREHLKRQQEEYRKRVLEDVSQLRKTGLQKQMSSSSIQSSGGRRSIRHLETGGPSIDLLTDRLVRGNSSRRLTRKLGSNHDSGDFQQLLQVQIQSQVYVAPDTSRRGSVGTLSSDDDLVDEESFHEGSGRKEPRNGSGGKRNPSLMNFLENTNKAPSARPGLRGSQRSSRSLPVDRGLEAVDEISLAEVEQPDNTSHGLRERTAKLRGTRQSSSTRSLRGTSRSLRGRMSSGRPSVGRSRSDDLGGMVWSLAERNEQAEIDQD